MVSRSGQVRIIAGTWRSRRLSVATRPGLRPTPDTVRETLFNWLAASIVGAHCLDLFAGSGALGFEAASRGADSVLLVDKDHQAVSTAQKNRDQLDAQQVTIRRQDAQHFLHDRADAVATPLNGFDIVFIDPPFGKGLVQPCVELLSGQHWLAQDAAVYVERALTDPPVSVPANWHERRHKRTGSSDIHLFDCS